MLNEGLHVKGAEACFMFRKTASGNIYLQQLGRILSNVNNRKHPIVFDLVDNISNDWGLLSMIGLKQKGGDRKVLGGFTRRYYGEAGVEVNSYIEEEKEFLRKLKRLQKERKQDIKDNVDEIFNNLVDFHKNFNRNPSRYSKDLEEYKLAQACGKLINRYHNELIYNEWKKYTNRSISSQIITQLREFQKRTNRNPDINYPSEKKLYLACQNQMTRGNKELRDAWNLYCKKTQMSLDEIINEVIDFQNKYHRNPSSKSEDSYERKLHKAATRWIHKSKKLYKIWRRYSKRPSAF